MEDSNLGAHDMGDVSLLGLDEFGEPVGPSAAWGALLGGGVSTGTAIGVRMAVGPTSKWFRRSEAIGMGAGIVAGGALMAFKGTRHMGLGALLTAVVTGLPRVLEMHLASYAGKAFSGTEIERIPSLNGAGFGITTMEQVPTLGAPPLSPQLLSAAQSGINNNPAVQSLPAALAMSLQGMGLSYGTSSIGAGR